MLHRDIKPANILVTKDDVVKLSDFGIARAVSQQTMALTKPGLVMGSVYYISPEQAQEHEVHETADLYSLGVVLYQMLTGKLPYSGRVARDRRAQTHRRPRSDDRQHETGVSPALAAIVNRLLQKKPEHRFQSASELATALREARERPAVPGVPASPTTRPGSDASLAPSRGAAAAPLADARPHRCRRGVRATPARAAGDVVVLVPDLACSPRRPPATALRAAAARDSRRGMTVADYTGMTQAQAQQAVVNAGLRTRFTKSASETVPPDHVIRQSPPAGTQVEKNQVVELVVSNGKPLRGLDDVRGYNVNDAQRTLQQQGFAVTLVRRFDNTVHDNVTDQLPKAGAKVPEGSRVTLIVSNGPRAGRHAELRRLSVARRRARSRTGSGITLDTSQSVAGMPADTIGSQCIAAGTKVDRNAIVRVVVNNGSPAPSRRRRPAGRW